MTPIAIMARNARRIVIDARETYEIARDASIRAERAQTDAYRAWRDADLIAADLEAEADAEADAIPANS